MKSPRRSTRVSAVRDLTESGLGSAVLWPGYMFLHLSCDGEGGGVRSASRREVRRARGVRRGDRAPPRLRAGGRRRWERDGSRRWRALTLRSTLDRWFRILPSTGSFWMKRHLPAPYFFTPLRSASSSSGDHCVRRFDGIACQRSEISGDAAERMGHRGLCADERGGKSGRVRGPWSWGRP